VAPASGATVGTVGVLPAHGADFGIWTLGFGGFAGGPKHGRVLGVIQSVKLRYTLMWIGSDARCSRHLLPSCRISRVFPNRGTHR
jgi:hypothetical protein